MSTSVSAARGVSTPKTSTTAARVRSRTPGASSSGASTATTPSKGLSDRFVPRRGTAEEQDVSCFQLGEQQTHENECNGGSHHPPPTPSKEELLDHLDEQLLDGKLSHSKVLTFQQKAPQLEGSGLDHRRALYQFSNAAKKSKVSSKSTARVTRQIPRTAEKILDAPNFVADYYLNLLDWSHSGIVALALDTLVYLWDAKSGEITELMDTGDDANKIASVKWAGSQNFLAVGLFDGTIEVWDTGKRARLRSLRHADGARIATLAWHKYFLASGCKDGSLKVWDVRKPADQVLIWETADHDQEVCGMAFRADGRRLATGGNDNLVVVYDFNETDLRFRKMHDLIHHQAAVKAVAWCPWEKDTLGTGGGTEDRQVCFWNTSTGELVDSLDTGSQVSSIVWSKNPACKEFATAHGYSTNAICVWKYPSLTCVAELEGHTERILHMVMSPDGTTVASASPEDETLRFWRIFDVEPAKVEKRATAAAPRTGAGARLGASRSIR